MRRTFFLLHARSLWGGTIPALVISYAGPVTAQRLVGSYGRLDATDQATFSDIMVGDLSLPELFHFGEKQESFWMFSCFVLALFFIFPSPLPERVTIDWGSIGGKIEWK